MRRKKSGLRKATDLTFGGAVLLQSSQLLTRPRTLPNLTGTAEGLVGIGVGWGLTNAALDFFEKSQRKPRRRR